MARPTGRDIRRAVLDEATVAMQSRGVAGFSFGDLASRVGVKAPSIHHHFPKKHDLVVATISAYRDHFTDRIAELASGPPFEQLESYCQAFLEPTAKDLLCLCGAAVAGWDDLDDAAQAQVGAFFDDQVTWVRARLGEADERGEVRNGVDRDALAVTIVSALEGALLMARSSTAGEPAVTVARTMLQLARQT
ncbi:MAG: helix-turn-helix domain-containing protein [Actinomycetota bacterium]